MGDRLREIAYEAPRCGCCDRFSSECAEDPCDEVRDQRVDEACGTPFWT